jgi:Arc/MetJ family transcription regulator
MSKRLQVVMDDAEYNEIQEAADARRLTVSAWVRQTLRTARVSDHEGTDDHGRGDGRPSMAGIQAPLAENVAPDPALIRQVMQRHGLATPTEAIDFALRRTAEPALTRGDMLSLRGTGWSGDLAALRAHPKGTGDPAGGSSS